MPADPPVTAGPSGTDTETAPQNAGTQTVTEGDVVNPEEGAPAAAAKAVTNGAQVAAANKRKPSKWQKIPKKILTLFIKVISSFILLSKENSVHSLTIIIWVWWCSLSSF